MKPTERELKDLTQLDNRTRVFKERNWHMVDGHNPVSWFIGVLLTGMLLALAFLCLILNVFFG